jgi:hypothetical protein
MRCICPRVVSLADDHEGMVIERRWRMLPRCHRPDRHPPIQHGTCNGPFALMVPETAFKRELVENRMR